MARKLMTCIYCRKKSPSAQFLQREHVIPESFGSFRNNLVLHEKVCDSCNDYFGRTLDIRLARDTYEGLERFSFDIRKDKEYKHLGKKSNLIIRIGDGPFKNAFAFFEYSEEKKRRLLQPLEQIGLKKKGSEEYEFFRFDEFPSEQEFDRNLFDLSSPRCLIVLSERLDKARSLLQSIGINFIAESSLSEQDSPNADVLLEVSWKIDNVVRRSISKIAFNYLARWNNPERLLNVAFDPVRYYVRYGQKPKIPIMHQNDLPILGDETQEGKARVGHIVTLEWNDYHDAILAKVSLFNAISYKVLLSAGYKDLKIHVDRGHFWNVADKTILELMAG